MASLSVLNLLQMGLVAAFEVPDMIRHKFGRYKDRFQIGDQLIMRPAIFTTKEQQDAFETVGRYLTHPCHRNQLYTFFTRLGLQSSDRKIPSPVWQEVLAFYASVGALVPYWQLVVDDRVPYWDANGVQIERPYSMSHRMDAIPSDKIAFWPGFLTDAQRASLIGTNYATDLHSATPMVTITDANFERVYYRPQSVFNEDPY